MRIEIDGQNASAEELYLVSRGFGHFTAMQVRDRATRGLGLHLRRLERANRELFGAALDHGRVRRLVRQALADDTDASVRVYIHEATGAGGEPRVIVSVRSPAEVGGAKRLKSVEYLRPQPHLKHLASGQAFYGRLARRDGFDDALLIGRDGLVAETAVANVGFFDGDEVVWPEAPLLRGITMQLLEGRAGLPSRRTLIRLSDMTSFSGAFICSARGIAAVSQVDDVSFPNGAKRMERLIAAYEAVPWEVI